ncbi:MAG: YheV family putative metal-binding protein [Pseudomonadales bacterium]|nr:YheV family putative metal-binding protein [Pseudomonadales bacterium]
MSEIPTKKPLRRFIAGAECPSCKKNDTIYLDLRQETEFRVCIRCEFEEPRVRSVEAKPLRFQPE